MILSFKNSFGSDNDQNMADTYKTSGFAANGAESDDEV